MTEQAGSDKGGISGDAKRYFKMFDGGSFPQHPGVYSEAASGHIYQTLMASQRAGKPSISQDDDDDTGRQRLYDKLREEQLAQIKQAVEAHEYRIVIVNITPEADTHLKRYGYTRTSYSHIKGRESTYEFVVDQTQEERARALQLKSVPEWVYSVIGCSALICCLCCCIK